MHEKFYAMSRALPPLTALRAFEAASRHLSFTRAAAELGVTQAAVSHQVKALETKLGVKLFRRLTRELRLTEEGHALAPGLGEGFDRLAAAVERVRTGPGRVVLTVSTLTTFAMSWLVPRLPARPGWRRRAAASISIRRASRSRRRPRASAWRSATRCSPPTRSSPGGWSSPSIS